MNKKAIMMVLIGILSFAMVGCSDNGEANLDKTPNQQEVSNKKDIPDGLAEEKGEGSIIISTEGGTSEDGNTPTIFADTDLSLTQIGLNSEGFDGSKLSYIYIDGMLNSKEQLGEMTQTSITLEENAIKEGIHKVEIVQYDNDDPTGNVITYKNASYEIKLK